MSVPCDRGLTLVEALVAMALTAMVMSGVFLVASWQVTMASVSPEAIDLQQRARAGMNALTRELSMAGAGPTAGSRDGPLVRYFAPVLPRMLHTDPHTVVRDDAIAVVFVPVARAQSTLAAPLASGDVTAVVSQRANCPQGLLGCGFDEGASLVVFEDDGKFDVAGITGIEESVVSLRRRAGEAGPEFGAGASVAAAETHVYYFDPARWQLRHHDGDRTDTPVVSDVVQMAVEYFGDVSPPWEPRPALGASNCLYDLGGTPRPELTWLGPPPFTLVPLPLSHFADGPWCGEGATRFDADLLRVRVIRIRLRLQAGQAAFRGVTGHVVPGTSRRAATIVPDFEITFDVAPRNMAVIR